METTNLTAIHVMATVASNDPANLRSAWTPLVDWSDIAFTSSHYLTLVDGESGTG